MRATDFLVIRPGSFRAAVVHALSLAACQVLFAGTALAATINVPGDQPTIQAAINIASNGDTVLVAPGTYFENVNFQGKAITVTSSGGPSVTTINGGGIGTVVMFIHNEGKSSVLSGFTLTNGNTYTNYQSLGVLDYDGGGIYIQSSSPTITGNVITKNVACGNGGGIAAKSSSALIQGNTITSNTQDGCSGGNGGGIYVSGSGSAQIIGNTISNNYWSSGNGGGIAIVYATHPAVENNTISGNTATGISPYNQGGGIYIYDSAPRIIQNLIAGNTASRPGEAALGEGGGVYFHSPSSSGGPLLLNNTIANNFGTAGSGVYAENLDSQAELINNLIVGSQGQPAVYCGTLSGAVPPVTQSTDAFSLGGNGFDGICTGLQGTNGNISADPLFLSPTGNFHLQYGSPVIDAGTNSVAGLPSTDLDGNSRVADGDSDGIAVVDMGAYELIPATDTISPSSLTFGDQAVGTTSPAQVVTVTNAGNQTLLLSVSGDANFGETDNCSLPVAPGGNCTINVTFTPLAMGTINGSLTVRSNAQGSPQTVALTGTGHGPVVSLTPTSLDFGSVNVGSASAPQTITLQNTGNAALNISGIAWSHSYTESDDCDGTVAAGASCTITITFTPETSGLLFGYFSISDNAANSPQSVFLSGTGLGSAISLTPSSVSFGNQIAGTTSAPRSVTLQNTGSDPISISAVNISTSGSVPAGTFLYLNYCPATLAVSSSCVINVYFSPKAIGPWMGQLLIYDSVAGSPQSAALSGTGTVPVAQLSPTSLTFGLQAVGTTSPPQTVTLTNTGSVPLGILSITAASPFAQGNNCGSSVAPGASCIISVTFTPYVVGTTNGLLSVTDSSDGALTFSLSGSAAFPMATLFPTSLTFGVTNVGTTSASQAATLSNTGSVPLTISSITAAGNFAQTNNCGGALHVGASCTITVTFTPTASGYRSGAVWVADNASGSPQVESLSGTGADFALSASPSVFSIKSGQKAQSTLTATAVGGALAGSVSLSCSGLPAASTCAFSPASVTPDADAANSVLTLQTTKRTGKGGTPAGTYSIFILGNDGALAHRIYVTLTVN